MPTALSVQIIPVRASLVDNYNTPEVANPINIVEAGGVARFFEAMLTAFEVYSYQEGLHVKSLSVFERLLLFWATRVPDS